MCVCVCVKVCAYCTNLKINNATSLLSIAFSCTYSIALNQTKETTRKMAKEETNKGEEDNGEKEGVRQKGFKKR